MVKWNPLPVQDPNGRILGYNVYYKSFAQYYSEKINIARINDTNMPRAILPNIPTGDYYKISVAALTTVGPGPRSYHVYKTKGKYTKPKAEISRAQGSTVGREIWLFLICIQEILFVTKSSVGTYVCFLLTAKAELLEKNIS